MQADPELLFRVEGNGISRVLSRAQMGSVLLIGPRETSLDAQSASLVEHIRTSLIIQAEMFRRILDSDPRPSLLLAEVLEDAGNRTSTFGNGVGHVQRRS